MALSGYPPPGCRGQAPGRGLRNAQESRAAAAVAAANAAAGEKPVYNPYAIPDAGRIKGGKRSTVAPRSGNRNMTFG